VSGLDFTDPRRVLRTSSVFRFVFGVAGLLWPAATCRACGIEHKDRTEETEFLMRVVAARDLVLVVEHVTASFETDEAAARALRNSALTGIGDSAAVLCELARRRSPRGGMRAGITFVITDGIGLPLLWWLATSRRRSLTSITR
jgi:hypothetical protein